MQAYSDPKRESDPHALPDVEVWYWEGDYRLPAPCEPGWFWQSCFPGCLPDSDPIGPFDTEEEALADAQQGTEGEL